MTYKIHTLLLALLFITVFIYVGQTQGLVEDQTLSKIDVPSEVSTDDDAKVVLTIWTPTPMLEYESKVFEANHPDVDIQIQSMDNDPQMAEHYLDALAEGNAPDLLVLTQRMLGSFNSIEKLADLNAEPFQYPEEYREKIGPYLWGIHQSLDGERTIAMPYDFYPQVLYYREDLLREAGYPSEPEELAAYLQTSENWLKMSRDLKGKGISTIQWEHDLLTAINAGQFFFNNKMEYVRSSLINKEAIEIMRQSKDLSANATIWSENGVALLKQNKLAMVMMPSYGENNLAQWLPEQAGKWRVTELPLGARAIDYVTSKSIAVSRDSKNKEIANKFLQSISQSGTLQWYKNSPPSVFLGGQNSGDFYLRLIQEQSEGSVPSPFDDEAFIIWRSTVDTVMVLGTNAEEALETAERQIMDVVRIPLQQLLEYEK